MAITGLDKACILIKVLEEHAKDILKYLDENSRIKLLEAFEDSERPNKETLDQVLQEANIKIKEIKNNLEESHLNEMNFEINQADSKEMQEDHLDFNDEKYEEDISVEINEDKEDLFPLDREDANQLENELPKKDKQKEKLQLLIEYLENQPVQLSAFYLKYAEESEQIYIAENMSETYLEEVQKATVHKMPISETIFKSIKVKIEKDLQKQEEERQAELNQEINSEEQIAKVVEMDQNIRSEKVLT